LAEDYLAGLMPGKAIFARELEKILTKWPETEHLP
jgi:hypothetical protein